MSTYGALNKWTYHSTITVNAKENSAMRVNWAVEVQWDDETIHGVGYDVELAAWKVGIGYVTGSVGKLNWMIELALSLRKWSCQCAVYIPVCLPLFLLLFLCSCVPETVPETPCMRMRCSGRGVGWESFYDKRKSYVRQRGVASRTAIANRTAGLVASQSQ